MLLMPDKTLLHSHYLLFMYPAHTEVSVALWPMADEDGKKTKSKGKNKAGDKKVAAVAPTLDIDQVDNSSENMLRLFLIHCIDIVFPS